MFEGLAVIRLVWKVTKMLKHWGMRLWSSSSVSAMQSVVLCSSTLNTFFVHPVALWLSHFSWWDDVKCVIFYRYHKLLQIWRPSVCKMPTKTPCSLGYPPVITHSGLQSHVSFSEVRWGKVSVSFYYCLILSFLFLGLRSRSSAQAHMWLFQGGVLSFAFLPETTSFIF